MGVKTVRDRGVSINYTFLYRDRFPTRLYSGESVPMVLERAIENYRRSLFLSQANQAFAALRQNEALWQEEQEERALWDQTGRD